MTLLGMLALAPWSCVPEDTGPRQWIPRPSTVDAWTPTACSGRSEPLRIRHVSRTCAWGTWTLQVTFHGCPEDAGVEIVGGFPREGEDHRPFHLAYVPGGAWSAWVGPEHGTLSLPLAIDSRHWRADESTSFGCGSLVPLGPEVLSVAAWLHDPEQGATRCVAWGLDPTGLVAGAYDGDLVAVDASGMPEPGEPPPGGWRRCRVIPAPGPPERSDTGSTDDTGSLLDTGDLGAHSGGP